jgi:acyl-CoA reductase-like NAD-dependent aldehyde dehydrogenase
MDRRHTNETGLMEADVQHRLDIARLIFDARSAQAGWRETSLRRRLAVITSLRHLIARNASYLSQSVGERPGRAEGETLALEVLPLADACRFLEREAEALLAPKRLGSKGRPLWLSGASAEIRREPLGVVLVVAPSNYPLFLPGVQIVQALVAGNAVLIKPAPGCADPMRVLLGLLEDAGLPAGLCILLDETVEAGREAIAAGVDKLVLTGSAETGRRVLADLAPHLTPAVMELSGNDAVFVLPGADLDLTAKALAYGLRLNGGATCIAPRRVFADRGCALELEQRLAPLALSLPPVAVPERIRTQVARLLEEAEDAGCRLIGPRFRAEEPRMAPVIVADAVPELGLLREDIFAPVLSLVPVAGEADALDAAAQCPYALGASIFGPEPLARSLAGRVRAGSVIVNDLIVPTADPRLPFGGQGVSGFGTTRGAEGLLEMTVLKTITLRSGHFRPHYDPVTPADTAMMLDYIAAAHGDGARWPAVKRLVKGLMERGRGAREG